MPSLPAPGESLYSVMVAGAGNSCWHFPAVAGVPKLLLLSLARAELDSLFPIMGRMGQLQCAVQNLPKGMFGQHLQNGAGRII